MTNITEEQIDNFKKLMIRKIRKGANLLYDRGFTNLQIAHVIDVMETEFHLRDNNEKR